MAEREQLEQAIAAFEAQRDSLGDEVVDAAISPIKRQLTELEHAEHNPGPDLEGERNCPGISELLL